MLRLITFLSENRNVILFLFLEVIALNLIIRFNDHQRHILGDALLEVTGNMQLRGTRINNYFNLYKENIDLNERIATLEETLHERNRELKEYKGILLRDSLHEFTIDSLSFAEKYEFIPCRPIKNTTHQTYNYITLNKGRRHGAEEGMGVVSAQGIAGRVIRVSNNFSIAQSALNISFSLSTEIEGLGSVGIYEWGIKKSGKAYINHIPADLPIAAGLGVYTSGNSTVFPQGYRIGKIVEPVGDMEDGFRRVELELATDFTKLGSLFLVPAMHENEIESLEIDLPKGDDLDE